MRRRTRFLIFVAAWAGLSGCGDQTPPRQLEPIRVKVVDGQGNPAPWAKPLLKRTRGNVAAQWDPEKAVLLLPRESAPHGIRVSAVGHRISRFDDIRDDVTVTVRRGLVVEIETENAAVGPRPPRVLVLRVRPAVEGDPAKDAETSARISAIAEHMYPVKPEPRGDLPHLPTRHWGFGLIPSEARNGFYVPNPGTYVVHWGLLDTKTRLWFTLEQTAGSTIEVVEREEPQRFKIHITEDAMLDTEAGLQRRIDGLRGGASNAPDDEGAK